jgi:8-oxo-dGTP pyrophosphatase MutT (NUDIX family)
MADRLELSPTPLRAAGGVVLRAARRERHEVAVIHRPSSDDWTLPKGKLDAGETAEAAALREVEEETGLRCQLMRPLGCTSYFDRRGRGKIVCFWLMRPISGRFRGSREVDRLRWLIPEKALNLLSYERDQAMVRRAEVAAGLSPEHDRSALWQESSLPFAGRVGRRSF